MHEISLCEGILQVIESEAEKQSFKRVKMVCLEIGELSCVENEALIFAFDSVIKNSIADGAKLEIVSVPGTAWCMKCGKNVRVKQRFDQCPECDSYQLQATGGDEMRIKELEVE